MYLCFPFFLLTFTGVIIVYAFQELSLDIILLCMDASFCFINYCSVFNTFLFLFWFIFSQIERVWNFFLSLSF